MKSLEIVKKNKLKIDGWNECVLVGKDLEQIIKDLEVLEILRNYIKIDYECGEVSGESIYSIFETYGCDIEDFEKIKQWLEENENDN